MKLTDVDGANNLVKELGRRIRVDLGEAKSTEYLLQRLSVAVQWGNSVLVIGSTGGRHIFIICLSLNSCS